MSADLHPQAHAAASDDVQAQERPLGPSMSPNNDHCMGLRRKGILQQQQDGPAFLELAQRLPCKKWKLAPESMDSTFMQLLVELKAISMLVLQS